MAGDMLVKCGERETYAKVFDVNDGACPYKLIFYGRPRFDDFGFITELASSTLGERFAAAISEHSSWLASYLMGYDLQQSSALPSGDNCIGISFLAEYWPRSDGWGGPPVDDPLAFDLYLDVDDDVRISRRYSLAALMLSSEEFWEGEDRERMASALESLAKRIRSGE